MVKSHEHKEEDVRKLIAAAAILAVVFVVGCQDTKKVTELQGTVDKLTQQVTDMTGQVAKLTTERDSLNKVVVDLMAKMPQPKAGKPALKPAPAGAKKAAPPTKK
jgi:outer membrane murein-binding lipoprotein Lpp